jgi:hypothetical protein
MSPERQSVGPVADRVRGFWFEQGARPRLGASDADIRAAEIRLGVRLPEDVQRFFGTVNGTEGTSEDLFQAWSLNEIGTVPNVVAEFGGIPDYRRIASVLPNAAEYFAFADAMIWSQVLAVRITDRAATEVVWISGCAFALVASTFEAFWERYLTDPEAVVWARGAHIHRG